MSTVDQKQERDGDSDEKPRQDVEDENSGQRGERCYEVRARRWSVDGPEPVRPHLVEAHQRRYVHELYHRGYHDRGQGHYRKPLDEAREKEERQEGQPGDDEAGDLRLRSCAGVDSGFREAAADHHTAREPRPQVRGTQPEQLPIGVQ